MATIDQRLLAASEMIIADGTVADIGTDHGQLPLFLLEKGLSPLVIATEWGDGPFCRARKSIAQSPWKDSIQLRQGYGLEPLKPGEVQNVVIMGMGGDLLAAIISRDWLHSASFERLVLQPMTRPAVVRRILAAKGWVLLEERVVQVKNRFFVLMSYRPGTKPYQLSPLEEQIGQHILKSCGPTELAYMSYCWRGFRRIADSLSQSGQSATIPKLNQYQVLCRELEDIINGIHG